MKDHSFIRPDVSLGEGINCLTLTSHYFSENQIDPKKDTLIKNLTFFEGIPIQYMDQVHGNSIGLVTTHNSEPIKSTDAIFTSKKGLALAALTVTVCQSFYLRLMGVNFLLSTPDGKVCSQALLKSLYLHLQATVWKYLHGLVHLYLVGIMKLIMFFTKNL